MILVSETQKSCLVELRSHKKEAALKAITKKRDTLSTNFPTFHYFLCMVRCGGFQLY